MQITVTLIHNTISPDLTKRLKAAANRRGILRSVGTELVSVTKRAFAEPSLRPSAWAPRKSGGSHSLLRKSGTLSRSPRLVALTDSAVTIGSDRPYAAIHQLGGQTRPHMIRPKKKKALAWPGGPGPRKAVKHPGSKIPARPFFPFTPGGQLTVPARLRVEAIISTRLGF